MDLHYENYFLCFSSLKSRILHKIFFTVLRGFLCYWTFRKRFMLTRNLSGLKCTIVFWNVLSNLIIFECKMRIFFEFFSLITSMNNDLLRLLLESPLGKSRDFLFSDIMIMEGIFSLLDDVSHNLIGDTATVHSGYIDGLIIFLLDNLIA